MSSFCTAPNPTSAKRLLLPNGHRSSSDRICRIVVDADRSQPPDFAYVAVFETTGLVFEGLVELDALDDLSGGDRGAHRISGGGKRKSRTEISNDDLKLWRR